MNAATANKHTKAKAATTDPTMTNVSLLELSVSPDN